MKRILSLALACALLLVGCSASQNREGTSGKENARTNYALSEPLYPEFPQQPVMPEGGPSEGWEAYREAYDKYQDALAALRGEDGGITEAEHAILNTFAARSTALVLASQEGENAIYSPLSLWSALAMLAQCAGGNSRRQVLDAIGAEDAAALQNQVEHIWRALYTDDGMSSLILANSIWLNSNMEGTYVQDTLDTLAQKYYAGAYSVPMGTGETDAAVTQWVNEQTKGLIGSDAPVVQTDTLTLALLVSSLYYKAAWQNEFMPDRTETDTFTDAAGQETQVDFMHRTEDANFIRREGYQAARLVTQLGEMVFVLPDQGIAPESLLQEEDFLARLEFYGDAANWGEVQWSVPKFDVNSGLDLMDALKRLGITDLPDYNRADLSALTDLDAFLSEAKQLARVKVDEEGVEAAAVTILIEKTDSLPPQPTEVCVMDLDRPFLFVIRTEDVPLFIGVVNQM
ncbi:serpin family protein [Oscillospiraceae bacterium 44-34]